MVHASGATASTADTHMLAEMVAYGDSGALLERVRALLCMLHCAVAHARTCLSHPPAHPTHPPAHPTHPPALPPSHPWCQVITPIFAYLSIEVAKKGEAREEVAARVAYDDANESLTLPSVVHKVRWCIRMHAMAALVMHACMAALGWCTAVAVRVRRRCAAAAAARRSGVWSCATTWRPAAPLPPPPRPLHAADAGAAGHAHGQAHARNQL